MTLEQMIRRHPVVRVSKTASGNLRLYLASNEYAASCIAKGEAPPTTFGWIVECSREHDWRPLEVVTVIPIGAKGKEGEEALQFSGEPVDFCGVKGLPWIHDVWSGWSQVGDVIVPLEFERRTIPASVGSVINRLTLKGTAQEIETLPDFVWFGDLPPESFGKVGVLVDSVRGVAEHIDSRPYTERDDYHDRVLQKIWNVEYTEPPARRTFNWRPVDWLALLIGIAVGILAVRLRRRPAPAEAG
jgi:hypothetical protein